MRILSLIDALGPGGAEQVLVTLVTGLPEHEHAVIHCSRVNGIRAHGPFVRDLRRAGVPVADVDWRAYADPVARRAAMNGLEPDVVLCHWWGGTPWAAWMRELDALDGPSRPRFVCVLHATGRHAPAGFDRYVVLADAHRAQVPDGGRVALIPNGVDTAHFRPSRRPRPAHPGALAVGRLARLDPGKTPEDLVAIVAGWDVPGAAWRIAGDGTLRPGLEADAARLSGRPPISFLGNVPRSRVPAYLRSLDVLCHITGDVSECHPLALLEALACGVPVVAERRGGIPEIVRDGHDGLLADGHAAVGERLRDLARDPVLRARLSEGARAAGPRVAVDRQLAAWRLLLADVAPPPADPTPADPTPVDPTPAA